MKLPPQMLDLIGLNETTVTAMPIVDEVAVAVKYLNNPLSIAGSRHSQGGHTMLNDAPMLLTETLNKILTIDAVNQTITVQAGATWNNIHHALESNPIVNSDGSSYTLSVKVQQSSAHFTVGGSLSVNCHGRDPRFGSVANTVVSLTVLLASGVVVEASNTLNQGLFLAVLGGYGSCGMIVDITLKLCRNDALERTSQEMSVDEYDALLQAFNASNSWPNLHYGWLNFSGNALFESLLSVSYQPVASPLGLGRSLREDGWIKNEALQFAWNIGRKNSALRSKAWDLTKKQFLDKRIDYRTNWLRESVGFTAYLDKEQADILQEYFVPLSNFKSFIKALKALLERHDCNVLSGTVRIVPKDETVPHLSYAANQLMVSIAIDVNVAIEVLDGKDQPTGPVFEWTREAIELARSNGGSYYLPYYPFAKTADFQAAYPNYAAQLAQMNIHNPVLLGNPQQRQFNNRFTQQMLP